MKWTRDQVEQQLRAEAPTWAEAVGARNRAFRRSPSAKPRAAWGWAVAAGVALAVGVGLWWQDGGDRPPVAMRVTVPRLTLPALPEARVTVPHADAVLQASVDRLEDPLAVETERLASDAQRAWAFLVTAVPRPVTPRG